ncbi:uncharacterized protein LOC128838592 [Malaclemys terrapin pileata]|uniref:uncharacterized protein LOC128838592 n=1 Tax=Malaclemys terrapin pileata TaxID=2991368 RepID=UPI0023A8CD8F|nr:uncharacterized protein LOC128838592 [Malaclemys terrapin pileata]
MRKEMRRTRQSTALTTLISPTAKISSSPLQRSPTNPPQPLPRTQNLGKDQPPHLRLVSQPSLSSHSQRLARIRHKKKRTREDMFSELIACSRAQAAQQTQWRENLTRMHQANMDREERWRQEDQQATQTLLGLMREQTDTLRRLVDVLQERRQEDRAPLQSISNRPPPPPSPILPSPKVHRRRGGRVPANSHSTPAESSSSRRLSFPKI